MKIYLILIPLIFGFPSSYAQLDASKDISCQQTLTNDEEHGAIYDVTCTDFSSSVEPKNRIDSCVLIFSSSDIVVWGWSYSENTAGFNFIHPVELRRPTNTSCSMIIQPTDELTSVIKNKYETTTGKYFEF